ncbi:MAG: T9SS type A sorting domain-containing protein [Candidatus Cloacimonetes bacterium]|nr:T9SS type A sorting domain-containing protein [Candidatus Cloacimonadota bacterium]
MIKIYFIVLISMFMLVYPAFSETLAEPPSNFHDHNAGSEENPFLIANLANLRWLSETPYYWAGTVGKPKRFHFIQTSDIDATETKNWDDEFMPIGEYAMLPHDEGNPPFNGTYNGNNHIISNLFVTDQIGNLLPLSTLNVGLFGYLFGAVIENVRLENITVISSGPEPEWLPFIDFSVGSLAGRTDQSIIRNCSASGNISIKIPKQGIHRILYVGGLVGQADESQIIQSSFSGKIDDQYSDSLVTFVMGGLIGTATKNTYIEYSYSLAYIYNHTGGEYSRIGGLIGNLRESTLQNSFFYGLIYDYTYIDPNYRAGLVGYIINSNIKYCYIASVESFVILPYIFASAKGFIAASVESIVKNSFWDKESTGFLDDFPWIYMPYDELGLSTAEMKNSSTYINDGWDFIDIWDIDPDINDGYPFLREDITASESETGNTIIPLMQSIVYPNPVRDGNVTIRFSLYPLQSSSLFQGEIKGGYETEIRIYNLRGQLVKSSRDFQSVDTGNVFVWDRRDEHGQEISSGVYFYRITSIPNERNDNSNLSDYIGRFVIVK